MSVSVNAPLVKRFLTCVCSFFCDNIFLLSIITMNRSPEYALETSIKHVNLSPIIIFFFSLLVILSWKFQARREHPEQIYLLNFSWNKLWDIWIWRCRVPTRRRPLKLRRAVEVSGQIQSHNRLLII